MSEKRRDNKGRLLKDGESQRKDGRYQYRYTDIDGTRRCIYNMDLHQLRRDEEEIRNALRLDINYHDGLSPLHTLVERVFRLKRTWTDSTRETMEHFWTILQKSQLCETPINKVKVSDIKEYLIALHDDGYAYGSVATIFTLLKLSFQLAIEDIAIIRDPTNFSLSDVIKNDTPPVKALTPEQEYSLLDYLREDKIGRRHLDMVIILLGTGLRISEFAALTVDDVDFENNMIHVNKQLKKLKKRTIIDRPKTPNAVRNIPMTKAVRESLTHLVEERRKNPNTCMIDGVCGFLSVTRNGRPRCHSEYDDAMRAFMARYNEQTDIPIERCTPHVLRHTYCTRCIAAGIDIKSAQYLMGHADVSTTLNIYADIVFDKVIASVQLLDQKSS